MALATTAAPAAAACHALPSGGLTVFFCDASEPVVFGVSGGLLRHNRDADPDFADEFDFNTSVGGSQHLSNAAATQVQVFGNISSNFVRIGNVGSPASQILVTFNLTNFNSGNDDVTIDDLENATTNTTITVSANEVTGPGGSVSYDAASGLETLNIYAGAKTDSITVRSTAAGTVTVIDARLGDDTFIIGNDTLDGILGPLTVRGRTTASLAGSDQLFFLDSAETAANTYTLTDSTLQRTGMATITYEFVRVLALTIGSGADTLTINELPPGLIAMTLDLGAGNDRIVWDTVSETFPVVTVEAGPGTDTFQFNSLPMGSTLKVLDCAGRLTFGTDCTSTIERLSIGAVEQAVINGSPVADAIEVTARAGLALTVNGLAGNDFLLVSVAEAGATVTVNGGEGNDQVFVGSTITGLPTAALQAIRVPVTVDGGVGTNDLFVGQFYGSPAPPPPGGSATLTITPTQVGAATGDNFFGPGGSVTYAGFQTLIMFGHNVNDTVRVTPSATTEIRLFGELQATVDTLDVILAGATGATLDLAANPSELRFANRQKIQFSGFETRLANGQPIAGLIELGAASFDVAENGGPATITVTRSSAIGAASVQLATSDSTASGGVDYAPAIVTVQFASGETSKTVGIAILNDSQVEGLETVNLTLSSVVGLIGEAALGPRSTAVLRIADDEAPGAVGPVAVCAPRPNVQVTTTPAGNGELRVTLRSRTLPATPANALSSLRVVRLTNAQITLNGQALQEGQTVALAPGTQEVVLALRRVASGQGSTAHLAVTDICGDWPTFVGGGAGAF